MENLMMTSFTEKDIREIIKSELNAFAQLIHNKEPEYPQDERITIQELKELYKVSKPTIHKYMKQGLRYEKLGRKTLFVRSDVNTFFRRMRAKGVGK